MRFRRIGVDGLLLPDAKEQAKPESDQSNEETYVDSLTLQLRHDTSDIYVPLPGGELSLAVKRSVSGELWSEDTKGYYGDHPDTHIDDVTGAYIDRPFGLAWTSGLSACLRIEGFEYEANDCSPPPRSYLMAGDENGMSYRFHAVPIVNEEPEMDHPLFIPVPSNRTEKSAMLNTLTVVTESGVDYFQLTRKFGTKVTYFKTAIVTKEIPIDSEGKVTKFIKYYRIRDVVDRFGNKLIYSYTPGTTSVIPSTITATVPGATSGTPNSPTSTSRTLVITSVGGLVQTITDPRGKTWAYTYTPTLVGTTARSLLTAVAAPPAATSLSVTQYSYENVFAADTEPSPDFTFSGTLFRHLNLKTITSDLGYSNRIGDGTSLAVRPGTPQITTFNYYWDNSIRLPVAVKSGSVYNVHIYNPYPSRPRIVISIELPDGYFTYFSPIANLPDDDPDLGPVTSLVSLSSTIDPDTGHPTYDDTDGPSLTTGAIRMVAVTDAAGSIRIFHYSAPQYIDGQEIENLLEGTDTRRPPFILIAWNQCVVYHPDDRKESVMFDIEAGLADSIVTDYSGNITQYYYTDPYLFSNALPGLPVLLKEELDAIPLLKGVYNDPTTEVTAVGTAAGVIKTFEYTVDRFMSRIRVLGDGGAAVRTTTYSVQPGTGIHISETIARGDGTVPAEVDSVTDYEYDPSKKSFVTKQTVKAANHNAGTFTDLVTVISPTPFGNVASSSAAGYTTSHLYDANNNKTQTTDPRNGITYFSYDDLNRLISTQFPDDTAYNARRTGWSPSGRKIWDRDENRHVTIYAYDQRNRLITTIQDMDALEITDFGSETAGDIITRATYDGVGNLLTQTDGRNVVTEFVYDTLHRKYSSTLDFGGLNLTTLFHYDGANSGSNAFLGSGFKPTSSTDPRGYQTFIEYDARYRPVKVWKQITKSPAAISFQAASTDYDVFGNVKRTWSWRSPVIAPGSLPAAAAAIGTSSNYDALDRPLQVVDGIHGVSDLSLATITTNSYTPTSLWHSAKADDTIIRHTETDFDSLGRPFKIWAPRATDGAIDRTHDSDPVLGSGATVIEYDGNGNKTGERDTLCNWTRTSYDARNRPLRVAVNPATGLPNPPNGPPASGDQITRNVYDRVGNLLGFFDARGYLSKTGYDFANRPIRSITPSVPIYGQVAALLITYTYYDKNGNVTDVKDSASNWTRNTYDNLNRLFATAVNPTNGDPYLLGATDDIIVQNTYDNSGNLLTVMDGMGSITEFTYDGLNRKLNTVWDKQDPSRDREDQITTYDALLPTSTTNAMGQVINHHYDNRNRLTGIECVGATSNNRTMILDRAGRLLKVLHGEYDPMTESWPDDIRNVETAYDFLDRVTSENSAGIAHIYEWDKQGNRKKVTYGNTGRVIQSNYDHRHRLSWLEEKLPAETNWRTTIHYYDANSNITDKFHANGTVEFTTYDAINRRSTHQVKQGSTVLNGFTFAYDAASNLRQSVDSGVSGTVSVPNRTVLNTYDRIHRLHTETATDAATSVLSTYGYDKANNRTSKVVVTTPSGGSAVTENHAYVFGNTSNGRNSNQLFTWTKPDTSVVTYVYDANGNRFTQTQGSNIDTYTYDYFNRLVQVDQASSTTTLTHQYAYDHRTRRVTRQEQTPTDPTPPVSKVSYSGGTSVLEYSGTSLAVEYVRGSDWGGGVGGILYSSRSAVLSWAHYNGRGDVVSRSDVSAALTFAASYEAFGTRTEEAGTNLDRQRANTKEEDPTGLLNEGFRYRDLATGMFITRDPMGFVDGPNVYTYVRQNPWSAFDPEGLWEWSKFGNSLLDGAASVGELAQDAGSSINEIAWMGAAGWGANERFNRKALAIGVGLIEIGGKGIDASHQAAAGNWGNAAETVASALGDTPEEAVANLLFIALTEGAGRYLKGPKSSVKRGDTSKVVAPQQGAETAKGIAANNTTRVGRWMNSAEYEAMKSSGVVQADAAGMHRVAVPASPSAYKAAPKGDIYVEYDLPSSSLSPGGTDAWRTVHGPGSPEARLAEKKGLPAPELPKFENLSDPLQTK